MKMWIVVHRATGTVLAMFCTGADASLYVQADIKTRKMIRPPLEIKIQGAPEFSVSNAQE